MIEYLASSDITLFFFCLNTLLCENAPIDPLAISKMKEWQITEYIETPSAKATLSLNSPNTSIPIFHGNVGLLILNILYPKPESWQSSDWIEWHQCCTYKPPLPGLLPQRKTVARATLQSTNMATEHETFHIYIYILVILCHWTSWWFWTESSHLIVYQTLLFPVKSWWNPNRMKDGIHS